ncbi:10879_t:CDS:2 [Racocetra fulgida]|uniref:ribonuclease III n=1 Tax=Racocetra fulgida TaxID=60492 RepID=A0A9N8YWS0_9GLOM|nr:10879_t:CDS:2 [Racocetra fulgida]
MAKRKIIQKNAVIATQLRDVLNHYNQFVRSLHIKEKSHSPNSLLITRQLIKKLIIVGMGAFFTTAAFYFLMDPLRIYNPGLNGLLKKITQCLVGTESEQQSSFFLFAFIKYIFKNGRLWGVIAYIYASPRLMNWTFPRDQTLLLRVYSSSEEKRSQALNLLKKFTPTYQGAFFSESGGIKTIYVIDCYLSGWDYFILKPELQKTEIIDSIKDTSHFQQAFTHTSFQNESGGDFSYENLEFLGDSVLGFATALFLYRSFPNFSEGQLSKLKQLMVRESTLAYLSQECGLAEFLRLGAAEKDNHRAVKTSILADIFESFLGALYLEKGEKIVYEFLGLTLFPWVKDYKSRLQEFFQAQKNKVDYYLKETKKIGNKQVFVMEVRDELNTICEIGCGSSKKEAEQQAAGKAIHKLGLDNLN